jgi:hypothetical protein
LRCRDPRVISWRYRHGPERPDDEWTGFGDCEDQEGGWKVTVAAVYDLGQLEVITITNCGRKDDTP